MDTDICAGCKYSLKNFLSMCENDDRLKEFLKVHGVIDCADVIICPKCNKPCKFFERHNKYVCNTTTVVVNARNRRVRQRCGFIQTSRKNTFFSGSKKSVQEICQFVAFWLVGFKQEQLELETEWSRRTVVDWVSFCREVCFIIVRDHTEPLGGPGKIVEIDEAKFGRRKYNRGRIIEGQWIFGGIERESKKVFMVPVADRSQDTLLEIIKEWILPETTVMSDCWRSYDCLENEGFQHLKVNHSLNFVDPDTGAHTQNVERLWRDIRFDIPRFGRRSDNFVYYLAEHYFHRKFPKFTDRFHEFFKYIAEVYPPTDTQHEGEGTSS
ncbi:uncharacterized protein LOC123676540 [Harmonia axyridis]|uniref:uncharacterized protein LOC123676540 n=1 Tax=Harmonia axyridis TaxID=115357 RepID=UPI001E275D76|nr:uncharacterized protein LOC123676540 [Harmonia axyridis]